MNVTKNNIIISVLSLMVIIYAYNDYIKPIIISIKNGKSIKSTITEAFTSQENFLSNYSTLSSKSDTLSDSSSICNNINNKGLRVIKASPSPSPRR